MTDQTTDRAPMSDERFARLELVAEAMWRNGQGPFARRDIAFVMAQIALDTLEPLGRPTTDAQVEALLQSFAEDAADAPPGSCPTPAEQLRRGHKALRAALEVPS